MQDDKHRLTGPKRRFTPQPFKKHTLAERVAASIEEAIIDGAWAGGEALPPEPEIAQQFGVSRAVVRDATRMLAARGLVVARHGKGVFVTHSPVAAFGEALLLALRRLDASNWDVTQFEQFFYPEVVALAAAHATEADMEKIRTAAEKYLEAHRLIGDDEQFEGDPAEFEDFRRAWGDLVQAIFDATHNKLIALLAQPLRRLRNVHSWTNLPETHAALERRLILSIVDLIAARDPETARRQTAALIALPPEAIAALKETPVGEVTHITLNRTD